MTNLKLLFNARGIDAAVKAFEYFFTEVGRGQMSVMEEAEYRERLEGLYSYGEDEEYNDEDLYPFEESDRREIEGLDEVADAEDVEDEEGGELGDLIEINLRGRPLLECNGVTGREALNKLTALEESEIKCSLGRSNWKITKNSADEYLLEGNFGREVSDVPEWLTPFKNDEMREAGQPTLGVVQDKRAYIYRDGEEIGLFGLVRRAFGSGI
jgi:hypothetical protein